MTFRIGHTVTINITDLQRGEYQGDRGVAILQYADMHNLRDDTIVCCRDTDYSTTIGEIRAVSSPWRATMPGTSIIDSNDMFNGAETYVPALWQLALGHHGKKLRELSKDGEYITVYEIYIDCALAISYQNLANYWHVWIWESDERIRSKPFGPTRPRRIDLD